ncbi:hypothetical protein [Myxococcus qinghaiensis]|uniref:hypothetical protein n=1 Tax=Myxococcus qinghaiensis TaxID=2906758 RepID=UPI0020A7E9CA|nr:hypothetical protein [Myxococcus qinghaiensis]MCP3161923.1 hypothetical protein [Myxococcus qinghaiensis]
MTRLTVLLALLLSACGSSAVLPAPTIRSVSPREAHVGYPGTVRVTLDVVLPIRVDYSRQEASAGTGVRLWFGAVEAPLREWDAEGTLSADVPQGLGPGAHDIRVVLADGREALREDGFTLTEEVGIDEDGGVEEVPDGGIFVADGGPEFDGGSEPDGGPTPGTPMKEGDITGFEFEVVPEQTRGQPFVVTVRALGPRAAEFEDKLDLVVSKTNGGVSPTSLDMFVAGVCAQSVSVDVQGANVSLTVTDRFGVEGTSNAFKVK